MTATMTKPSQRSINYLTDLVRDRDVEPGVPAAECLAKLAKWLATPRSQKDVSAMIDRSRSKPRRPALLTPVPVAGRTAYVPYPSVPDQVPNAKFAVLTELLQEAPDPWRKQEYLFFEVKELRKRRVIRRLLGAPGAFSRSSLPAALATELFGHLGNEEFAFQASRTFGEIYQCCGKCSAELTDDLSRERQFGPICWAQMVLLKGGE